MSVHGRRRSNLQGGEGDALASAGSSIKFCNATVYRYLRTHATVVGAMHSPRRPGKSVREGKSAAAFTTTSPSQHSATCTLVLCL